MEFKVVIDNHSFTIQFGEDAQDDIANQNTSFSEIARIIERNKDQLRTVPIGEEFFLVGERNLTGTKSELIIIVNRIYPSENVL